MPINGVPQEGKAKNLGAKPVNNSGNKGGPGCLPALLTFAALGTGWLSMLWQGVPA